MQQLDYFGVMLHGGYRTLQSVRTVLLRQKTVQHHRAVHHHRVEIAAGRMPGTYALRAMHALQYGALRCMVFSCSAFVVLRCACMGRTHRNLNS